MVLKAHKGSSCCEYLSESGPFILYISIKQIVLPLAGKCSFIQHVPEPDGTIPVSDFSLAWYVHNKSGGLILSLEVINLRQSRFVSLPEDGC